LDRFCCHITDRNGKCIDTEFKAKTPKGLISHSRDTEYRKRLKTSTDNKRRHERVGAREGKIQPEEEKDGKVQE
jgi:hypothetical protein